MSSKVIVLLGLLLAVALLVSSEVASARELAALDPSEESDGDAVSDAKYQGGGYGGNPRGGRGGGYSGRGGKGGSYGGNGGGHGGNGGGHGGNGGGHGGNGGGHGGNGGGHGGKGGGNGGGCRHGCCGQSYKGGCRCCTYAGEKADAETQN